MGCDLHLPHQLCPCYVSGTEWKLQVFCIGKFTRSSHLALDPQPCALPLFTSTAHLSVQALLLLHFPGPGPFRGSPHSSGAPESPALFWLLSWQRCPCMEVCVAAEALLSPTGCSFPEARSLPRLGVVPDHSSQHRPLPSESSAAEQKMQRRVPHLSRSSVSCRGDAALPCSALPPAGLRTPTETFGMPPCPRPRQP